MSWEDLNKDNIEEIKDLYINYIQENKDTMYKARMESFEEFIGHLHQCRRCGTYIDEEENYCICCKDDLFS